MTEQSSLERPAAPDAPPRPFAIHAGAVPSEGQGDLQSGNLTWRTLIAGERTPSNELSVGVANFPADGCLKPHRHAPAEVYFGLSGAGTVTVDGERFDIAKDVVVFIPGGALHGVVAGPEGLAIFYAFARATFDDIVYEFADDAPTPSPLTRPRGQS
jgi:quercetin dioxygenase-like cupin family protein